ncbi:hypothetical protein PCANC_15489 [Puccinia coronata f. sp. avenae]|uniref:Wax synthase domain-containing protein n=1 Tax=Puccinia coronata f. sp. avenae TaxID=200324 RepID=A0A2N5UFM9_9BASI|nr:hypothetical protein PCANC_15489 [Puccinia coronata f. sp. avenae]
MGNMNATTAVLSLPSNVTSRSSSTRWLLGQIETGRGTAGTRSGVYEVAFVTSLMAVQCALLHPTFQFSRSARLARLAAGPLLVGWWLCFPFRLPVQPFETRSILPAFLAGTMALKSIEWTFVAGPYHMRTLKIIHGVPWWMKEPPPEPSPSDNKPGWSELALWTILQFNSQRGFRWSWGPASKGNQKSFLEALLELARLQAVMLPCLAFVLHSQDWTTHDFDSRRVFLDLGVPCFPGLKYVASVSHSVCAMLALSSSIEIISLIPVLCTYLVHPISEKAGLPETLSALVDPRNFPAQFAPLFGFSSLAHFWGNTWHQKLRRHFLFCGGKPAIALARSLCGSPRIQKASGTLAVFLLSGLFHEYLMYGLQRTPHPHPRELFKTFPGSLLFFAVQPLGLALEPMLATRIPKSLGGAKVWAACFLLLTAPLFTSDVCRPGGMFNQYRMPHEWTWLHFLIPAPFAARLLPHT